MFRHNHPLPQQEVTEVQAETLQELQQTSPPTSSRLALEQQVETLEILGRPPEPRRTSTFVRELVSHAR